MQLSFGGYDAKLPNLLEAVVSAVKSFDAVSYSLKKDNLERVLDGTRRDIRAARAAPASSRCIEELGVLTERPKFPLIEAENALKKTNVESLRKWLTDNANVFGSVAATDVLVEGNCDETYARRIEKSVRNGLTGGSTIPAEPSVLKCLSLPKYLSDMRRNLLQVTRSTTPPFIPIKREAGLTSERLP